MTRLASLILSGGLAGFAAGVYAQQSVEYGSVSGRVRDATAAAVPGAQVTVRHLETNAIGAALADGEGRFRFAYLRIGPQEITVRARGFANATRRLTLTAGSAFELPIELRVETAESLTVSGETPVLESARSQVAGAVSEAEVAALPLNGRNFLDIALLVPGVSPTNVGGGQMFAETSAVSGPGISIGSQRNLSNNFIVDGLSANDDAAGLSGIAYSVDSVAEFQVVTSGGQAELGRALGGYVNLVTKSGTNARRGDAYGYFRDQRLNAPNPLTLTKLPMTHAHFGASHGGPIVRDRTFYFVNFEKRNLDQSGLVTIAPENVAAINARLASTGYRGAPVATGEYRAPVDIIHGLAKVDHEFSLKDRVSVRYSLYDLKARNARNVGGLSAPSAAAGLDNLDQTFAVSNVAILSAQTVLESRGQIALSNLEAAVADPLGPSVSIAGVAVFGTSSGNPTGRRNHMYQVVNNLSHLAGSHSIRAGLDFLHNDAAITFPRSARGAYTFSSLANFLTGAYNNSGFVQTFGTSLVSLSSPNLGMYAQDEWKVGLRLTINAGLRYDLQFLEQVETDRDNVSPRLGFAWTLGSSRRVVVRGSAGLFYDRVPLRPVANALLSAGNTTDVTRLRQITVSLSPTQSGAPRFPEILGSLVPTTTLPNLTTIDRKLQNAHSRQAGIEIEGQIGPRATASLGYSYVRGLDLIMSINQNVPACVASGGNNGCRPNPQYGNHSRYSSAGRSNYHGLQASLMVRPAEWGSARLSYTYSKSMNNMGEAFFSSPIDPFDLEKDWGRSDDDQRHRLVVSGTLQASKGPARTVLGRLIRGFHLGAMLQYYSALPLNITSGLTTLQGTPGRPLVNGQFIERNAGRGGDFFSLNARLERTFRSSGRLRWSAIVEAFNLTNRRNDLTRNGNFGALAYPSNPSPAFNQVTAVYELRGIQLGLRFGF